MAILFDKQKKPAAPGLLGQAASAVSLLGNALGNASAKKQAAPAQTTVSQPKPMYDFSNDALIGSQVMMQERGTQPPVSGMNTQEVRSGINTNVQNELARMLSQVQPAQQPAPSVPLASPAPAAAPAVPTVPPATGSTPAAPGFSPVTPTTTAGSSLVDPAYIEAALRNYSDGPMLMGTSANSAGEFLPASVSQKAVWNDQDESYLASKVAELQDYKNQERRAGVTFGDTTSNLERTVAGLLVRRQKSLPTADASTLSDDELVARTLRDQITGKQRDDLELEALRLNEVDALRKRIAGEGNLSMSRQNEIAREFQEQRDKLVNSLAARGLTVGEDSYASAQLSKLEGLYRDKAAAEAATANAAILNMEGKVTDAVLKAKQGQLDARNAAIDKFLTLLSTRATTLKNTSAAMYQDKKLQIEEAYKQGLIDYKQRDILLKEEAAPSVVAKNEASAANQQAQADFTAGAKTGKTEAETDFIAGAKTDNTRSQTALNEARTVRITTLLPAELAKMQAQAAKLMRAGSGGSGGGGTAGSATPAELEAVYRLNGGKAPTSEKAMATLLNQVRTVNGDVDNLVVSQDERAASVAAAKRKKDTRGSLFGPATPAPAAKPAAKPAASASREKLF